MLGFTPVSTGPIATNWAFKTESGSLAVTLNDIAVSSAGSIVRPALWDSGLWDQAQWSTVSANFGVTLENIAFVASGGSIRTGTLSLTLSDITPNLFGAITRNGILSFALDSINPVLAGADIHAGPIAVQLGDIAVSAIGNAVHNGSFAVTLADIVPSFIGSSGSPGTFALQLDDISVSFNGAEVHSGTIQIGLADLLIDFNQSGPIPVVVESRGGFDAHKKHKNFKNQKDETERDIQRAVNKVFGIEEPSEIEPVEETVSEASPPDFSAQIARMALEAEAKALGQTIEQYQAMLDAERDDEEALLLLL